MQLTHRLIQKKMGLVEPIFFLKKFCHTLAQHLLNALQTDLLNFLCSAQPRSAKPCSRALMRRFNTSLFYIYIQQALLCP
jgi:hypothetical protein